MKIIWLIIILFALALPSSLLAQSETFLKYRPHKGETITSILQKHHLPAHPKSIKTFYQINGLEINDPIYTHKIYKLPIVKHIYNGKSIRSTIGNSDWDLAVKIQRYNLDLHKNKVKSGDYREDKELWVPAHFLHSNKEPQLLLTSNSKMLEMEIFGKENARFPLLSEKLKHKVYYLVAGHGGPDPGAMSRYKNRDICEDEYSYDVTLRLAKLLIQHGASVEIIVQDPKDGIRSQKYLPCDRDEVTLDGRPLPLNQLKRLQQRSDVINKIYVDYRKNHSHFKEHTAVMIHVDSRNKSKRQDVYFYHLPDSKKGRDRANSLYQTFKINIRYTEKMEPTAVQ